MKSDEKIMEMLKGLRILVVIGTLLISFLIVSTIVTDEHVCLISLIITFVLALMFFYQMRKTSNWK